MQRMVVMGAGAVGGTIAALMGKAGLNIALVTRPKNAETYRENGLNVQFPDHQVHARPEIFGSVAEVDWGDGDVAVVATKLNDAEAVLGELQDAAGRSVPVVCGSNGIQGELWAGQRFENVYGMMIWMPSTHMQPGDFRVYGKDVPGVLDVGRIDDKSDELLGQSIAVGLARAGFDSESRDDIMRWKYAKLVTNVGNTAQALVVDDWKRVAEMARQEAESVLDAAGIDRVPTNTLLERCRKISLAPIDGQRRQGGSTWQSLKRGKPLETPWIEGVIVDLARRHDLSAPVNGALVALAHSRQPVSVDDFMVGF